MVLGGYGKVTKMENEKDNSVENKINACLPFTRYREKVKLSGKLYDRAKLKHLAEKEK